MFFGFIPVLFIFLAALQSFRDVGKARMLWALSTVLVAVWGLYHGSHHLAALATYGAW